MPSSSDIAYVADAHKAEIDPRDAIMGMEQEEFIKLARSIAIVIPHRGSEGVNAGLAANMGLWKNLGTKVEPIEDSFGGFIELTRGGIAKTFLNYCVEHQEVDKIVMIDADENVNWQAPFRLAQWDLPVVTGVVCSHSPRRGVFANFTKKDRYGVPRFPSVRHTGMLPTRGLIEIHSCGTGLICIRKHVFEAIFEKGDIPFYIEDKMRRDAVSTGVLKLGEDMRFCQQARDLGHKIHCDLSVHAVHFKLVGICWPGDHMKEELRPEDFEVDVKDYLHG